MTFEEALTACSRLGAAGIRYRITIDDRRRRRPHGGATER